MLTPEELYNAYSLNPCEDVSKDGDAFRGDITAGAGTPLYMSRVVQFLKHVKYPCLDNAPGITEILNSGKDKIGLPFKFLQQLDVECFTEIQPSIRSGTSHSVRNSCDLARACMLTASGLTDQWQHRMATEYIERFGENSLPDCLMATGPDLVPDRVANTGRAPSTDKTMPDTYAGMVCLPGGGGGVAGASRSCMTPSDNPDADPKCRSCEYCDEEPTPGVQSTNPCCIYNPDSVEYNNLCCKAPMTSRIDFSYLVPQDDITNIGLRPNKIYYFYDVDNIDKLKDLSSNSTQLNTDRMIEIENILIRDLTFHNAIVFNDNTIWMYINGFPRDKTSYIKYDYKLYHVGILERKLYGGYANLLDNSGSNFYAILDDIFLEHMQSINGWDYVNNTLITNTSATITRARTISILLDAQITSGRSPTTNTQNMADKIKDLLWNGYGVVLFSNIGFKNIRDSQGLAYPDRIWYNTYSIIGYDDTKLEFNECVYVLSCPWGNWITGGHPSWGPLPPGCFLVTESHLKCMLEYYPDREFYECRSRPCNPALDDCTDPEIIAQFAGCDGHSHEDKCEQYRCRKQQRSMGLVFAISLTDGFHAQHLEHQQFYPVTKFKEIMQERTLYYQYR